MNNKKLLIPIIDSHLPLLLSLLPDMLLPPKPKLSATLPSTPADRATIDQFNDKNEKRRSLYWDWTENVLMLLWCCAESNTKILTSLNSAGQPLIQFLLAFLDAASLGIDIDSNDDDDDRMELENKKGKKVKKDATKSKKERIPLFVAVTAGMFFSIIRTKRGRDSV
jgi:hypothetical protein